MLSSALGGHQYAVPINPHVEPYPAVLMPSSILSIRTRFAPARAAHRFNFILARDMVPSRALRGEYRIRPWTAWTAPTSRHVSRASTSRPAVITSTVLVLGSQRDDAQEVAPRTPATAIKMGKRVNKNRPNAKDQLQLTRTFGLA